VIDEKKARRYAERMKFSLTGTLGLLLLAREQGLIKSITREIEALQEAGLYLAPLFDRPRPRACWRVTNG
jgi:predicted nucleic acid-binding protein